MTGEVLKQFLVGLSFDVDESSLSKFGKSVALATVKVTALATAIEGTATAIGLGITKISSEFEELGFQYRIITPLIQKAVILRQEFFKAYSAAGINITKTVMSAYYLNLSLTKTRFILEALYKSVASRFFDLLAKQSDIFRARIYANLPKIQAILEKVIGFVFKMAGAIITIGERVWSILGRIYGFFERLDSITGGWSTKIIAVAAAWKILGLEFLATPLGALLAGLGALLLLLDDFLTYQEGGKSLINWGALTNLTDGIKTSLAGVMGIIQDIGKVIGDLGAAGALAFERNWVGAAHAIGQAFSDLIPTVGHLWDALKKVALVPMLADVFSKLVSSQSHKPGFLDSIGFGNNPILTGPALGSNVNTNSEKTNNLGITNNFHLSDSATDQIGAIGNMAGSVYSTNQSQSRSFFAPRAGGVVPPSLGVNTNL